MIFERVLNEELYTRNPVEAYLVHKFLADILPKVVSLSDQEDGTFYLKHPDDKGDHVLIDGDRNITGIIDWGWAYTASAFIAFYSPIAFLPLGDFFDGASSLGNDEIAFANVLAEKGREDLAEHVRVGRVHHMFSFCCGYPFDDWNDFFSLCKGLRDAVKVDESLS